jgi:FdrA protein
LHHEIVAKPFEFQPAKTHTITMALLLHTLAFIQPNLYQDSVALMRVAQRVLALPGVVNATLQMGNPANKEILAEAGLLTPQVKAAGPSDIMVVVQARTRAAAEAAQALCRSQLAGTDGGAGGGANAGAGGSATQEVAPRTLAMGQRAGMNLAQISVPGPYAAAEALKALKLGLNVFMFSDNVPLAQEVELKREATARGLLVMGPDCGTAIVAGVPLGFANVVRRGAIGLVAASGTGLQEVTTQIHRMGGGISHAIGTGGRDVSAEVGGATMLQGIALLARDAATRVIVIVSKPPAPAVTAKVVAALQAAGKPAVLLFLGSALTLTAAQQRQIRVVHTLVDAAALAVALAGAKSVALQPYALPTKPAFAPQQRYLRALFSGGTYAAEAQILWAQHGVQVWSNVPLTDALELPDPRRASREHTALDLGDDAFTVGRPHPMIDQAARIDRLRAEALDASVRVIVLDVVIGWGAHSNPAGELAPVIADVKARARKAGRELAVIGFVCGTEDDPQGLAAQEAQLQAAGMVLAGNSANAAWLAAQWLR